MQKVDKVANSLRYMEDAIKDIKHNFENNINRDNPLQNYRGKELRRILYNLNILLISINNLKYDETVRFPKIDEIRSIWHSMKLLLNDEDYELIMHEAYNYNEMLNNESKKVDDKNLSAFVEAFNNLPKAVKEYIAFSKTNETGRVIYGRSYNNKSFILEYYKLYKYSVKKVKKQSLIENDMDEKSRIELIIYALNKIKRICDSEGYDPLKETVVNMIAKYQKELELYTSVEDNIPVEDESFGIHR